MKLHTALPSVPLAPSLPACSAKPLGAEESLRLYHDPMTWRRWLDWVPKVCVPPRGMIGSPFTSPANTSLHQRIFLNGTSVEFPLK